MKKIIVMGNKDMSVECLDYLLKSGENVLGIICNYNDDINIKSWYKSLKAYCIKKKIKFWQPKNCNEPTFIAQIKKLQPDIVFSFSYDRIIKPEFIALPKIGIFNIHFAQLPKYRGCLPLVYALAEKQPKIGVTLHYIDPGIDSGDIVDQSFIKVGRKDTAYTLYFKCVKAGKKIFVKNLPMIKRGVNKRKTQNLSVGSYHPQEYPDDRWINWQKPALDIDFFIRALTFKSYPSARTKFKKKEFEIIYPIKLGYSQTKFPAGKIKKITKKYLIIGTAENLVIAKDFRINNQLLTTSKLVDVLNLKEGDILG